MSRRCAGCLMLDSGLVQCSQADLWWVVDDESSYSWGAARRCSCHCEAIIMQLRPLQQTQYHHFLHPHVCSMYLEHALCYKMHCPHLDTRRRAQKSFIRFCQLFSKNGLKWKKGKTNEKNLQGEYRKKQCVQCVVCGGKGRWGSCEQATSSHRQQTSDVTCSV